MENMEQFKPKTKNETILTFKLGESNFALSVNNIVRVEQAAAVTKVPNLPPHVLGLLNHHGVLIPVIDIRPALAMEALPLRPNNQFIIINRNSQLLAIVTDKIIGLTSYVTDTDLNSLVKFPLKISSIVSTQKEQIFLLIEPERLLEPIDLSELHKLTECWQKRML